MMSNPSKQKGTAFETLIRDYLWEHGFQAAHRTALSGGYDTGDINGIVNLDTGREVAVQCKNQKKFNLSGWLDATVGQAERLSEAVPLLVVKRPGKGAQSLDDTYAVMRLRDLVCLLQESGYT
jgi:Holliday junction resolvase